MTTGVQRSVFRRLGWPAAAVAGGLSALGVLRHRFESASIFLPDRYPNGVWNPEPYGLDVDDCWFTTADGVDLHGWWIPHPRARGTILYCHGSSGSIAHQIGVLRHLRRLRVHAFAFDYRGYGRSAGSPSERGLYRDVRAAHAFVTGALGRPPEEVVLLGHSLGGAVAIDAALDCAVAGLVVQSTFTDLRRAARAFYPNLPVHWLARRAFRSIDKVERLAMPKLFVHGTADGTLPLELGRELYERAAAPKELYEVAGAGHNDVHRYGGFDYLRRLGRFRDACLAGAATSRA